VSKARRRRTPVPPVPFQPADQADHDEAGIPIGHIMMRLAESGLEFGDAWADYTIEIVGEMMGHTERDPADRQIPRWPSLVLPRPTSMTPFGGEPVDVDPTGKPYLVKVWLLRVRCRNVPGHVEARWQPGPETMTFELKGLDGPDYGRANRALRGIQLLTRRLSSPGRPRRYRNAAELLDDIQPHAAQLREDGLEVTQDRIAPMMGIKPAQLRHHLGQCGLDWETDVKRRPP
jgi:hypothetical protein